MIEALYKPFQKWSEVGTVWIYSDPHFGDKELAAGIKDRPTAEEQVKMINAKVGRKDTLIILGDIGDIEYAKQLRGYKVLVCGNHDVGHTKYAEVFDEIYAGPVFIADRLVLSHEPIMLDFAFNIHGHNHSSVIQDGKHLNVCSDMIGYTPINFNQFVKSGALAKVPSIHRVTIDGATERKQKRLKKGKKKI
mgnify:FL=1|jgi:calcineurin-like phosphoesterase family protein